jgi:hypothetical protein
MKELNDDMDQLFRSSLDAEESPVRENAWNRLDHKLNATELDLYKRKTRIYRSATIILGLLLLGGGSYEFLIPSRNAVSENKALQPPALAERVSRQNEVSGKSTGNTPDNLNNAAQTTNRPSSVTNTNTDKVFEKGGADTRQVPETSHPDQHSNRITSHSVTSIIANPKPQTNGTSAFPLSPAAGAPASYGFKTKEEGAGNGINAGLETEPIGTLLEKEPGFMLPAIMEQNPVPLSSDGQRNAVAASGPGTRLSRFSVSLFFVPDITGRHLTKDHDEDDKLNGPDDDFDQRESPSFSYHTGVKVGYDLTNRWGIYTGLNYATLFQGLKASTVYATSTNNEAPHFVLNTSGGSATLPNVNGPPLPSDSLSIGARSLETLRFIQLPLLIQYSILKNNRITIYAMGGPSLDVLFSEQIRVEIPTPNGAGEVHTITGLTGVNHFSMGFMAGMGLKYDLNEHFNLLLEPVFKCLLTPINNNTQVKSYPFSYGLSFGIGYHF